jgi:NAD(P)-dependent dehydrogenase (short-subunit alcohol dehydrogenase family)
MAEADTHVETESEDLVVRDAALVTRAGTELGRAVVQTLAADGWRVYAGAPERSAVADLAGDGVEPVAFPTDDETDVRTAVEDLAGDGLDLVVNGPADPQPGAVEDVPTDRVRRGYDAVLGVHRTLRAVVPAMRETGDGTVVTLVGAAGRLPTPGGAAYAGPQAALGAVHDSLRAELAGVGVDAVLVEHGPVDGEYTDRARRALRAIDRTEAYPVYRLYEDVETVGGLPLTVEPEAVAEAVLEAATCADPDPRYTVGRAARLAGLARHLPDGLRDRLFGLLRRLA